MTNQITCSLRLMTPPDGPYVHLDDVVNLFVDYNASQALTALMELRIKVGRDWERFVADYPDGFTAEVREPGT